MSLFLHVWCLCQSLLNRDRIAPSNSVTCFGHPVSNLHHILHLSYGSPPRPPLEDRPPTGLLWASADKPLTPTRVVASPETCEGAREECADQRGKSGWLFPSSRPSSPSSTRRGELSPFLPLTQHNSLLTSTLTPALKWPPVSPCYLPSMQLSLRVFLLFLFLFLLSTRRKSSGLLSRAHTFGWKRRGRETETHTHVQIPAPTLAKRHAELSHIYISYLHFPVPLSSRRRPDRAIGYLKGRVSGLGITEI